MNLSNNNHSPSYVYGTNLSPELEGHIPLTDNISESHQNTGVAEKTTHTIARPSNGRMLVVLNKLSKRIRTNSSDRRGLTLSHEEISILLAAGILEELYLEQATCLQHAWNSDTNFFLTNDQSKVYLLWDRINRTADGWLSAFIEGSQCRVTKLQLRCLMLTKTFNSLKLYEARLMKKEFFEEKARGVIQ